MSTTAPTAITARPTVWIYPAMWGMTVVAIEHAGAILKPCAHGVEGKLSPLVDLVDRICLYVDENRAPDGSVTAYVDKTGQGADQVIAALQTLPDCTVVALEPPAPAHTVLRDVVDRAKAQGLALLPACPPPPEPQAVGGEAGLTAADPIVPEWQPLAPAARGNVLDSNGGAVTVIGASSHRDVVNANPPRPEHGAGGGVGGGEQIPARHDVIRFDNLKDPRAGAPAPREPNFQAFQPATAPTYQIAAAIATPPATAQVVAQPQLSASASKIEAAVRNVAGTYRDQVVGSFGLPPEQVGLPELFLWLTSAGLGQTLLADPNLAGERLKRAAEQHKAALTTITGLPWHQVDETEIALWMAEQQGAGLLPTASQIALADYKRGRRR